MRLGGLASGMDTDAMVEQMMKAESMKVDRVEADKKKLEWKKETLNDLNKDFANFILDSKKDLEYNSLGRPGNLDWATSATSSDEGIGTARAGKGALEGKHEIEVVELVRGVSGASKTDVTEKNWSDINGEFGDFNFEVNGVKIAVEKGDSIAVIAKKINDSEAGVNASYDENIKRFFVSTKTQGSDANVVFGPVEGEGDKELKAFLGVIDVKMKGFNKNGNDKPESQTTLISNRNFSGADGKVNYNGAEGITIESNDFNFNGVNFNVVEKGKFTVNVKTDTDAIVDKVKDFVAEYNKIIEQASKLLTEKVDRRYSPLSDDEKEGLTDKQIEELEKKAKSGIIARDSDVERILSSLRSTLYEELNTDGPFKYISDIGITTKKYSSGSTGGLLEIDEDKLRKAIAKDSDGVMDVLFKTSSKTSDEDKSTKTTDQGLFNRIFDKMTDGMKTLIGKSGPGEHSDLFRKVKSNIMTDFVVKGGRYSGKGSVSDIENDMNSYTKKIEQLKIQLAKKEEMYFAQFAAMEKAMYKANSQGDWLNQQMQSMF